MADTDINGEEQTEAPVKKTVAKKKTARKAAASKKVAAKKRTTKKMVAASAPSIGEQPVWDDDQAGDGLLGLFVQFAPVLLLIILMLVLSDGSGATQSGGKVTHSGSTLASQTSAINIPLPASVVSAGANLGGIEMPSNYEPWSLDLNELLPGAEVPQGGSIHFGTGAMNWDDPGAFYWGPTAVDEIPPAPPAQ